MEGDVEEEFYDGQYNDADDGGGDSRGKESSQNNGDVDGDNACVGLGHELIGWHGESFALPEVLDKRSAVADEQKWRSNQHGIEVDGKRLGCKQKSQESKMSERENPKMNGKEQQSKQFGGGKRDWKFAPIDRDVGGRFRKGHAQECVKHDNDVLTPVDKQ